MYYGFSGHIIMYYGFSGGGIMGVAFWMALQMAVGREHPQGMTSANPLQTRQQWVRGHWNCQRELPSQDAMRAQSNAV